MKHLIKKGLKQIDLFSVVSELTRYNPDVNCTWAGDSRCVLDYKNHSVTVYLQLSKNNSTVVATLVLDSYDLASQNSSKYHSQAELMEDLKSVFHKDQYIVYEHHKTSIKALTLQKI